MNDIEQFEWSEWRPFPDPTKKGILVSPLGPGLYQLKNKRTGEFVLFGIGGHLSQRITSLLPKPYGVGTRRNEEKREYVWKNIKDIEYRTISTFTREESIKIEKLIKRMNIHLFNT